MANGDDDNNKDTQASIDAFLDKYLGQSEDPKSSERLSTLIDKSSEYMAGEVYDFRHPRRPPMVRLREIDRLNSRLSRDIADSLFKLLGRSVRVTENKAPTRNEDEGAGSLIETMSFKSYRGSLPSPDVFVTSRIQPLRANALLYINADTINAFINTYFGGTHERAKGVGGDLGVENKQGRFSFTQLAMVRLFARVVTDEVAKTWKGVLRRPEIRDRFRLEYVSTDHDPSYLNITGDDEIVAVSRFQIRGDLDWGSGFHIVLPYSFLEAVREDIEHGLLEDRTGLDEQWSTVLRQDVLKSVASLRVPLVERQISLAEVGEWDTGTVIPIDMPEKVVGMVEQVPVIEGQLGQDKGRRVLRVARILDEAFHS